MTEFSKYAELKESGATVVDVWHQAEADGIDQITRIRLVRNLFGLTLTEAKAVLIEARSAMSLEEYQDTLVEDLDKILEPDGET